jgi:DNA-binding transcriptional regulator GbsR (MarR family)
MTQAPQGKAGAAVRPLARDVRRRLAAAGGRTSHDLGLGRIVGQMVVYLYLWDGDCSLDQIAAELGLSKAAVSVAARQLEHLGLIRRTWREGDRRKYYRTADNIGVALRQGLLSIVRNKIEAMAGELDAAHSALATGTRSDADIQFLAGRVKRAKVLRDRADKMLGHPLLPLLIPNR